MNAGIALFLSGFIGDIGTQLFATKNNMASLFGDYWEKYGRLPAAAIAGLITLTIGGVILIISQMIYTSKLVGLKARGWPFVFFATAMGFILGFLMDLAVNRRRMIPSLDTWYVGMGESDAALWSGGFAFAFVLFVSTYFVYM